MRGVVAALAFLSLLRTTVVESQVVKDGDEFQVNSFTTSGQTLPSATFVGAETSEFVVAWRGLEPRSYPLFRFGILTQRFDRKGEKLGSEIQANVNHADILTDALRPSIAPLSEGSFVVVWEDYRGEQGDEVEVSGRILDGSGSPLGAEFQVNTDSAGLQQTPCVATLADGSFVVVWTDIQDPQSYGSTSRARGRMFDASGVAGIEFSVSDNTASAPIEPAVAALPDGGFVVVWQATASDGSGERILGRRFAADGSALGSEFTASQSATSSDFDPDIASDGSDNIVSVWTRVVVENDEANLDIIGRRFAPDGNPKGDEFRVNTYTHQFQDHAHVAVDRSGSFLAVWKSFNQDGASGSQDGDGRGVFGQFFAVGGTAVGSEFQVNTHTAGDQGARFLSAIDVAASKTGRYVVVWASPEQDGDNDGIFAQMYCAESVSPTCGDATCRTSIDPDPGNPDAVTATDALVILYGAIGLETCLACRCDVNSSNVVTATDALLVLQGAAGQPIALSCPPCP